MRMICAELCGMGEDSIYLSPAPLYHAAPLRFNMAAIALGGTSIIMESFDAEQFLKLIEAYKVTQTQLVPTIFVRMLKLPEDARRRHDLSSLKGAIHAAAPCPIEVKARMIEWWGPILIEYYAGSEGNGMTVATSQQWLAHRGTVGRSVIGQVKILDDNDQEVPTGEIGSVYFAQGLAFSYHNDPEKTKRAHTTKGWSTLGDVGYLDADGFLYLTDRKSYMIISGGVNIYPQETEDLLITHPEVADVAVFGVPNEEMGEEVKAVVQPHDMARVGKGPGKRVDAVLPRASVADQMPEDHRLRGRIAAHADRQAGEASFARPLLAEQGQDWRDRLRPQEFRPGSGHHRPGVVG
jgi:acyl-CoA synthetase (AMP-forming)/AMP-acid ligase II